MDIEPERVLRSVQDPSVARALLRHERRDLVVNTSGAYYFLEQLAAAAAASSSSVSATRRRHGGGRSEAQSQYRLLSGLLPRLHAVFWPQTDFRNVKRQPRPRSQSRLRRQAKQQRRQRSGGRFAGLVKGSRVHDELRAFVLYDARAFQKTHRQVHTYTLRLLDAIVKLRHWTPLLPEFDIADEALGIGTSIDLVGVDAAGDLVLLEIKTGYQDYWDAQDGYMRGALALLPNTPCNRASLQVAVAALILHRRYQVPLARMHMYVLRIDDAQTQIVAVPRDLLTRLGDAIYGDLLRYNNITRHAKKIARDAIDTARLLPARVPVGRVRVPRAPRQRHADAV